MWRLGVLLAVSFAFVAADVKPTNGDLIQRLKRSPYECQNNQYPPPPPPPTPPPPPPPFWRHHRHHWPPPRFDAYSEANAGSFGPGGFNLACATCGDKGGGSISNAKSETGDAIAVSIAKASPKT